MDVGIGVLHDSTRMDIVIGILHDSILNRYCNWSPTWFNLEWMLELAFYMI